MNTDEFSNDYDSIESSEMSDKDLIDIDPKDNLKIDISLRVNI